MWKMTYVFHKQLEYVGNGVDMSEKGKICLKWLKYFDKRLKYVGYEVDKWEMA